MSAGEGGYEYTVQGDYGYGYGWENLTTEGTRADALRRLAEYDENEPAYRHRIVRRRVQRKGATA